MGCSPSNRRSISFALVAALVYQIGACACGCLEHNGWYLTATKLVALASHNSRLSKPPCESGEPFCKETHCDHVCHTPALFAESPAARKFDAGEAVSLLAFPITLPTTNNVQRPSLAVGGPDSLALPVRASLQVFRL